MKDDAERARAIVKATPHLSACLRERGIPGGCTCDQAVRATLAALAFAQQPEGWVLVPVVPTQAMIDAAGGPCVNLERADDPSYEPAEVWSAMLDVAPIPGEE